MRISKSTPSFDPVEPHWDVQRNFANGKFYEYASRSLNRWDIRLTHVILSNLPRSCTTIVGRALKPKQMFSDFLSIRIGATPTKLIPLSTEETRFITIHEDASITTSKLKVDFKTYHSTIPNFPNDLSDSEILEFSEGKIVARKRA